MKRITLSRVEHFLRRELKKKLRQDLRHFRILKEGDAECCIYHHLRRLLGADHRWRVFARKHSQRTGHYIDLLVFRGTKPRLAIEIKWHRDEISKKDRKSLRKARSKLKTKKNYFVVLMPNASNYARVNKFKYEKYRMFEIVVDLGYRGVNRDKKIVEWRRDKRLRFGV